MDREEVMGRGKTIKKTNMKTDKKTQTKAGIGRLYDQPRGALLWAAGRVVSLGMCWNHPKSHLKERSIKP